jgi:hypothetical protein
MKAFLFLKPSSSSRFRATSAWRALELSIALSQNDLHVSDQLLGVDATLKQILVQNPSNEEIGVELKPNASIRSLAHLSREGLARDRGVQRPVQVTKPPVLGSRLI